MYKIIGICNKNKNILNKMHKIKANDIPNCVKNKKIYLFIHLKFKKNNAYQRVLDENYYKLTLPKMKK